MYEKYLIHIRKYQVDYHIKYNMNTQRILKYARFIVRDVSKCWILLVIGDGRDNYLQWDFWHPLGPLLPKYGYTISYNVGLLL